MLSQNKQANKLVLRPDPTPHTLDSAQHVDALAASNIQAGVQSTAMKDGPNKGIVCIKEAEAGSIVRKNVCTTPAEREAARRRAAQVEADVVPSVGR